MSFNSDTHICPWCGSHGNLMRSFAFRSQEEVFLLRCQYCSSQYLAPQPSASWLEQEYSNYFLRRWQADTNPKYHHFLNLINKLPKLSPYSSVLDIGAGEGYFAQVLLSRYPDCNVQLVEQSLESAKSTSKKIKIFRGSIEEWVEQSSEGFDMIVALDLVEHLREPVTLFSDVISRHLKPGGLILITTPNAQSFSRMLSGRFWPHYKVEHLTYPTAIALEIAAKKWGVEILQLSTLIKSLPIGYILQVLSQFGPKATQLAGRLISSLTPDLLKSCHISTPSGELFFLAKKIEI